MESTKSKLVGYDEILDRLEEKLDINPIDRFLHDNEPAGVKGIKFREQLLEALNFEDEETKTERNVKVVNSFIEHCKDEGLEIPEALFESYFGA